MTFNLKIVYYWLKIFLIPKFKSRKDLMAFQSKKINQFAISTLSKSKYYRSFFVNKKFDWNAVSQISKTTFMNSFDDINTKGIKLEQAMKVALQAELTRDFKSEIDGITIGLSTGTSGKRGLFLVSESERAKWVALVMNRVIKPKLFKKQKVAFFLRANNNLYTSINSSLFEFKYFDIFKPLPELLQELNHYQPHILASQPSILLDIALAQKNCTIKTNPNQIISFAEVLHQNDKHTISTIFGVNITEVYQCTEGFLGSSCKYGTMHLNEDFICFEKEWIDENKFYPIITDFSRTSQPVVKYKLNDVLEIKKNKCACGSKLLAIEKIIGRDDDVLIFNQIKIYPDLIARRIALFTDSFLKYTITQNNSKQLLINIQCSETEWINTKTNFKNGIESILSEFKVKDIELIFQNNQKEIVGNKNRKIIRLVTQ